MYITILHIILLKIYSINSCFTSSHGPTYTNLSELKGKKLFSPHISPDCYHHQFVWFRRTFVFELVLINSLFNFLCPILWINVTLGLEKNHHYILAEIIILSTIIRWICFIIYDDCEGFLDRTPPRMRGEVIELTN